MIPDIYCNNPRQGEKTPQKSSKVAFEIKRRELKECRE